MSPALIAIISIAVQILNGLIPQLHITGLTSSIVNLVEEILAQLPTLWNAIKGGGTTTVEVTAALVSIQAVAKEAAHDPTLNPQVLQWVVSLDQAAQRALDADTAAQKTVDPATLGDIQPL
jgi:hypothetical protein